MTGRSRAGRGLFALWAVLDLLALLAAPSKAHAWASVEHQEIGRTSYLRACADLTATVAARGTLGPPDAGVKARFERVCGANLPVLAKLYGDATAIAGDFLGHPSEFLSHTGAWRFHSKKSYYLLALENSAHFNPTSTRSWAEYHQQAIAFALAGAAGEGLTIVEQFQLALFESAFADHYLQDSFAAGHMGFNRAASSAAAAKSFHDAWNARGRVAIDRAGHRWTTFGDSRLDDPANEEGRRHVVEAATLSIRGVLTAFVLGARVPEDELAVWQILPFTIEAPELLADVAEVFVQKQVKETAEKPADRELVPLQLTIRPAYKDMVATASFWSVAAFDHPGDPYLALVGGIELGIPFVPAQTYLGAGGTFQAPERKRAAVIDTGVLIPLGLSVAGLLSHQLNVTASWLIGHGFAAIVHGEYQLNIELGDVLLNLHAGLAEIFPQPRTGYYGAVGVGFVFSAAGRGRVLNRPGIFALLRAGGWRGIANRMRSATQRHQASVLAGGVAFFAFLSMFPALAALVSLYGLLANPQDVARQIDALAGGLPHDIRMAIHQQMALLTARSTGTLSLEATVGILAAIWAATKGMKALITGLSLAFGQQETRGFIRLNVTAFLFTMGAIVSGVISIASVIVFPIVLSFFRMSQLGEQLIRWGRWPMLTGMVLVALSVAYHYGPAHVPATRRWLSPGSVAATALWLAGSALFSWFASTYAKTDRVDGSLGVIITILTWFLLSAYIVILGAELDAEIARELAARDEPTRLEPAEADGPGRGTRPDQR